MAVYVVDNTTINSPNYTTSRDVTRPRRKIVRNRVKIAILVHDAAQTSNDAGSLGINQVRADMPQLRRCAVVVTPSR